MKVSELTTGDVFELDGQVGTFITQTEHPIWPSMQLVIWKLDTGEMSFDALDVNQELVGNKVPLSPIQRKENMWNVLGLGGLNPFRNRWT